MRSDSNIPKELSELARCDYKAFADYCSFVGLGLRKKAFHHLDNFLDDTKAWDLPTRAKFCNLLFGASRNKKDLEIILTTKLNDQLIKPTLLEMTISESKNFLPFKWYGEYFREKKFLKQALELNTSDESTKLALLENLEYDLWISTHHLPDYYLGNYEEDKDDFELALSICTSLNEEQSAHFKEIFTDYNIEIENYKSSNHTSPTDNR